MDTASPVISRTLFDEVAARTISAGLRDRAERTSSVNPSDR